jgi:hypothetical protein
MAARGKGYTTLTREQVAHTLEAFLDGGADPYTWDGFTLGMEFEDEDLDRIRRRCAGLSEEFPPHLGKGYCNEEGIKVIREYIRQLRTPLG